MRSSPFPTCIFVPHRSMTRSPSYEDVIGIPPEPDGPQLERLVAAHLTSRGCFVESGITLREPEAVSDADVVWTDYRSTPPRRHLIEAKSGGWSYEDVFKFYGWAAYLSLTEGTAFVHTQPPKHPDVVDRVADRLGIRRLQVNPAEPSCPQLTEAYELPDARSDLGVWWASFNARARFHEALNAGYGSGYRQTVPVAKEYHRLINDALFFESDPRARFEALYDRHWKHQKLALNAAWEKHDGNPRFEGPPNGCPKFGEALYKGMHLPIQACMYLQTRGRLYVLKAAVESVVSEVGLSDDLPLPFQKLRDKYGGRSWLARLPVLWQGFLWAWGGFLLSERLDEEYANLAEQSGIPESHVAEALKAFEILFEREGGWWAPREEGVRQLKLVPPAIRGIGAIHRKIRYGAEDFKRLGCRDHVADGLERDIESSIRLLTDERDHLGK